MAARAQSDKARYLIYSLGSCTLTTSLGEDLKDPFACVDLLSHRIRLIAMAADRFESRANSPGYSPKNYGLMAQMVPPVSRNYLLERRQASVDGWRRGAYWPAEPLPRWHVHKLSDKIACQIIWPLVMDERRPCDQSHGPLVILVKAPCRAPYLTGCTLRPK